MPAPSGRTGRPLWHWLLLGGAAAAGLLVVAVLAAIIAFQLLTRGDPQSTLEDFYTSLATTDCELFMDSTTEDFRDATGLSSCPVFEEQVGGVRGIDYEVDDRINRQGYAIFEVTESYSDGGESVEVQMRYYVRRIDGQWDLDGIEVVSEGTEPIT
ncbi:hypothetical protein ACT3SP_12365 [Brachybacterium sp. AOP43-C2-M15]|uniref:hypothetical protein n=1 Tax=Brachybacterium sp. AOP43-C2-M15 TaxID=3457661 RepID=UPI004034CA87